MFLRRDAFSECLLGREKELHMLVRLVKIKIKVDTPVIKCSKQ